ncbi:hypothetical protein OIO90_001932 [Microbotryomycetes sp. JL221]|nr:hypothetical protein OIO90_001932 [Microbotryomycetes sp. JL221]
MKRWKGKGRETSADVEARLERDEEQRDLPDFRQLATELHEQTHVANTDAHERQRQKARAMLRRFVQLATKGEMTKADALQAFLVPRPARELSTGQWKAYAVYVVTSTTGKLDDYEKKKRRITLKTTLSMVSGAMYEYIKTQLARDFDIPNIVAEKQIASTEDYLLYSRSIFEYDAGFRTLEERLVFAAAFQILCVTVSRPGEIMASPAYPGYGLRFKDFEFMVTMSKEGERSCQVKVTIPALKGHRDDPSHYKQFLFTLGSSRSWSSDPVSFVFSLAFLFDVFHHISTMSALMRIDVPRGQTIVLQQKRDKSDLFIFPRLEQTNSGLKPDPKQPYTTEQFRRMFDMIGNRIGKLGKVTPYTFRRYGMNMLNRPEITASDRNLIVGHSAISCFERHYQDKFTSVDVQAILQGQVENRAAIQALKGIRKVFGEVPDGVSTAGKEACLTDERLVELEGQIKVKRLQWHARLKILLKKKHQDELVQLSDSRQAEIIAAAAEENVPTPIENILLDAITKTAGARGRDSADEDFDIETTRRCLLGFDSSADAFDEDGLGFDDEDWSSADEEMHVDDDDHGDEGSVTEDVATGIHPEEHGCQADDDEPMDPGPSKRRKISPDVLPSFPVPSQTEASKTVKSSKEDDVIILSSD